MTQGSLRQSTTGKQVFERTFGNPSTARAGALMLHGLGEHGGRHAPLLELFAQHGVHCRVFDWPGHGRSPGQRGHLESMALITALIDEQHSLLAASIGPSKPIGLLGHSMGAFLALYHLCQYPKSASFAWIGSPLIDPEANASRLKRRAARILNAICPRFPIHSGIKTSQCRKDAGTPDPLMHRTLTVRLGTVLVDAAKVLRASAHQFSPDLRLLMTHGSADIVCPPALSKAFFDHLPCVDKTYATLDGALHEPYFGDDREAIFDAIAAWLKEWEI